MGGTRGVSSSPGGRLAGLSGREEKERERESEKCHTIIISTQHCHLLLDEEATDCIVFTGGIPCNSGSDDCRDSLVCHTTTGRARKRGGGELRRDTIGTYRNGRCVVSSGGEGACAGGLTPKELLPTVDCTLRMDCGLNRTIVSEVKYTSLLWKNRHLRTYVVPPVSSTHRRSMFSSLARDTQHPSLGHSP